MVTVRLFLILTLSAHDSRSDCSCQQPHTNKPEVRTVRPKKRSALIKPSQLLEVASHTAMGVAVGLGFAFLVTHVPALGIATLINYSPAPDATMLMFVGTCTITFGIGATLTGLAITLTEDSDTTRR
jgi:hypothetical protein